MNEKDRVHFLLEEIAKLPRAERLIVQAGIKPLCVPSPRIDIHHPTTDLIFTWNTGLHHFKSQYSTNPEKQFNPQLTPSLIDYLETMECVNAHPTSKSHRKLRKELCAGFTEEVLTSSRIFYGPQSQDTVIHNWRTERELHGQGLLRGLSGALLIPPSKLEALQGTQRLLAEKKNTRNASLAPVLFGGRALDAVVDTIKTFTGCEPHILRQQHPITNPVVRREYGVSLRIADKEVYINLLVSDHSVRSVHGLEVMQRTV